MLPLNEIRCEGAKVASYEELASHEQQQFMSMAWLQVTPVRAAAIRMEKKKSSQTDVVHQWFDLLKSCYLWWYR